MRTRLVVAAVAEIATGVALLVVPSLVGQLLLGAELTGVAITVEPFDYQLWFSDTYVRTDAGWR